MTAAERRTGPGRLCGWPRGGAPSPSPRAGWWSTGSGRPGRSCGSSWSPWSPRATGAATCRRPPSAARASSPRPCSRRCWTGGPTWPCTRPRTCPPSRSPAWSWPPSPQRDDPRDVLLGRHAPGRPRRPGARGQGRHRQPAPGRPAQLAAPRPRAGLHPRQRRQPGPPGPRRRAGRGRPGRRRPAPPRPGQRRGRPPRPGDLHPGPRPGRPGRRGPRGRHRRPRPAQRPHPPPLPGRPAGRALVPPAPRRLLHPPRRRPAAPDRRRPPGDPGLPLRPRRQGPGPRTPPRPRRRPRGPRPHPRRPPPRRLRPRGPRPGRGLPPLTPAGQPLAGLTVLVPRARDQASDFSALLRARRRRAARGPDHRDPPRRLHRRARPGGRVTWPPAASTGSC